MNSYFERTVTLFLCFVILMPSCVSMKLDNKYARSEEKNLMWHEGQQIVVEEIAGDIKVEAGKDNELTVTGLKTVSSESLTVSRRESAHLKMVITSRHDEILIVTHRPPRWRRLSGRIDYTITAPAAAPLVLKTVSGNIKVRKMKSSIKAGAVSGDVVLEEAGGDAEVRSVSGGVFLKDCEGKLVAETVSGDIRLDGTAHIAQNISFKTVSGDTDIALPTAFQGTVRVFTVSGEITSDLPLQITNEAGRRLMEGTIGEGDVEIAIKSVSGDVYIQSGK
ncbi:MAG: DUF4097 family beta strand repeat-containing protein [bacterium]